jgi:leucyl aminopeptidase
MGDVLKKIPAEPGLQRIAEYFGGAHALDLTIIPDYRAKTMSMRFTHTKRLFEPFSVPTLAVLSESEWKKGKWLAVLPEKLRERIEEASGRLKSPLAAGGRICVSGRKKGEEDFWIALLPADRSPFVLLEFARDGLGKVLEPEHQAFRLVILEADEARSCADAFGAALAARIFLMPVFGKRTKDQKPWQLEKTEFVSSNAGDLEILKYGYATGEGTNLARFLATLPPNILDSANYGERIRKLASENGLTARLHSKDQLKKMGAGAFTAVDQGDPDSSGGIWEIAYSPKKKSAVIHLVGKGICFDTGGYDVKVGGGMMTMKGDMQGSAVALATLVTAAQLKLPYRMKAYLAVTENHISPRAYKADEVVTALNGLTIEVVNTDAEGRMVLADTLTLASREKPDLVIDFATLTGAAVRSIGTKYSAGFTNREELHEAIREAGRRSGERVWTFPIDKTFEKALESKVADTVQCLKSGGTDHIYAACFLSKFVEEGVRWIHIDLSAAENEGGLGHVDSLFTGFGVRWALELIRSQ